MDDGSNKHQKLSNISTILSLDNKNYMLAGVVTYQGSTDGSSIGHYIAYYKSNRSWLKYDDMNRSHKHEVDAENDLVIHMCVYIKK